MPPEPRSDGEAVSSNFLRAADDLGAGPPACRRRQEGRSRPHRTRLSDPLAAQPTFLALDVGPNGESLTFELTVTDNGGLQATDSCIVNITWVNLPPVADAGVDQTVDEGDMETG